MGVSLQEHVYSGERVRVICVGACAWVYVCTHGLVCTSVDLYCVCEFLCVSVHMCEHMSLYMCDCVHTRVLVCFACVHL